MSSLTRAAMSDLDCGEGRVRDLDGTCVKKVIIHKKKKPVCSKLSIDNGNIFLFGRMVQFYCDTEYIRVPDTEIAICQVTGQWSKVVPACLLPGCQSPSPPSDGEVELLEEFNNTVAVFSCSPGYTVLGQSVLGCIDGKKWNGSSPQCQEVVSHQRTSSSSSSSSSSTRLPWLAWLALLCLLRERILL